MNNEPGKVGTPPERYRTDSGMQPFDVIDAYGLTYYEGNAFKYLVRAHRKGEYEGDIRKARHFLQEALLRVKADVPWWDWPTPPPYLSPPAVIEAFGLTGLEERVVEDLLFSRLDNDPRFWLRGGIQTLSELIDTF